MSSKCILAVLMLAMLTTKPVAAEDKKQEPLAAPADSASLLQKSVKGKVLESLSGASNYTYLLVEDGQEKNWLAIPKSKIEVGQTIAAQPGMVMKSFESKELSRTFDQIVFSPGLENAGVVASGADSSKTERELGAPMDEASLAVLSGGSSRAVVPADDLKMDKVEGEQGQTVEECFANAEKLNKQKIRVRGKVVKFSPMIMGKNWIHLQDGTGDPMKNTHDLVATTLDAPEKDSVVVIEGVLNKDRDFGAGYTYAVIIEDAKIVK